MITIFSTPKPFRGHAAVIQRNALESWVRLHPDVEVILFGDDQGAAEIAHELCIRHIPESPRHPSGFKYLNAFFARAQEMARHPVLCFANCDIIFLPDLLEAVATVASHAPRFLMVGKRWDVDITQPLPFAQPDWAAQLRTKALHEGKHRPSQWIDYFVFPRGFYDAIPAFVIGRVGWDNWLVGRALTVGAPVVDASAVVTAVHQNHDYGYHPQGQTGVWHDDLARRNVELAGGFHSMGTIDDATHLLTRSGVRRNWWSYTVPLRRTIARGVHGGLSAGLRVTRPIRHALGIRKENMRLLGAGERDGRQMARER
jgi:hypothetical protein